MSVKRVRPPGGMYSQSAANREESRSDAPTAATRLQHYGSSLVGLAVVVAVFHSVTPVLFDLAAAFAEFSATALVFGLAALWVLVWLGVETAWGWGAGRLG